MQTNDGVFGGMVRLDRALPRDTEEVWLQNGARMWPYITRIGSILSPASISVVIQESARILLAA